MRIKKPWLGFAKRVLGFQDVDTIPPDPINVFPVTVVGHEESDDSKINAIGFLLQGSAVNAIYFQIIARRRIRVLECWAQITTSVGIAQDRKIAVKKFAEKQTTGYTIAPNQGNAIVDTTGSLGNAVEYGTVAVAVGTYDFPVLYTQYNSAAVAGGKPSVPFPEPGMLLEVGQAMLIGNDNISTADPKVVGISFREI